MNPVSARLLKGLAYLAVLLTASCSSSIPTTPSANPETATPASTATNLPISSPTGLETDQWIVYMQVTAPDQDAPRALRLVRADGTDDVVLVDPSELPSSAVVYPSWSPDGLLVAFGAFVPEIDPDGLLYTRSDLWVIDVDGTGARRIATCELPCLQLAYPDFSPDGKEIALLRYDILPSREWGPTALEVLNLASGERRIVAATEDGVTAYYEPTWAPDGRSIALVIESYTDANEETLTGSSIAVVSLDDTDAEPTVVTPVELLAGTPDWGIGQSIVFAVPESVDGWADTRQIYTVDADGGNLQQVTSESDIPYANDPVWTANGSRIVFATGPTRGGEQWLASIGPDGSDLRQEPWKLHVPSDGFWRTGHQLHPGSPLR